MPIYHSQYQQDELLDTLVFQQLERGVFVDVGAHDGLSLSNTAFFELKRDWSGICIEPNPSVFTNLPANRPRATCLNIAIGEEAALLPFVVVGGSSNMLSGLAHYMSDKHRARIRREIAASGGSETVLQVPVKPLRAILAEHRFREVHYLSIDTEGNEIGVLRSADFDTVRIHVISVECNAPATPRTILAAAGADRFAFAGQHRTDVFLINRDSPLAEHVPALKRSIARARLARRVGGLARLFKARRR